MGAPKGNKNALGNDGGRPPFYDNRHELQKAVDNYFDTLNGKNPTITGLALGIGFCSRSTLYEYRDKVEFSDIIKRAMSKVEQSYEEHLRGEGSSTGSIFALKNMGWTDRQSLDVTSKGKHVNAPNSLQELYDEEKSD